MTAQLEETHQTYVGQPRRRREDPALLTGSGHFVEDVHLPGMLHMAVLRSPYPHARIVAIDTAAARALPGVVIVATAEDVSAIPDLSTNRVSKDMAVPPHPPLARGAVHAVGEPVAVAVARDVATAMDAVSLIEVEYDPLPAVPDIEAALAPDAPLAREELTSNLCYRLQRRGGDPDRAFQEAAHVTRLRIYSPRLAPVAMEPRGLVAAPDPYSGSLTVWLSTQAPHRAGADLAAMLRMPENHVRVIAPDVGGGFGSKGPLYREDVLASYLALKLGKPVAWVATRSEDLASTIQGRDVLITAELALAADGTMTGLRVRYVANLGAYLHSSTGGPPMRPLGMATGTYRIPNADVEVVSVLTNTVPTGPYRGAGRPECVLFIERLVDKAARELGMDPVELRRRSFIQPEEFPYRTAMGTLYDSGDYQKVLDKALEAADYAALLRRRDEIRAAGQLAGVGVVSFAEPSGGAGFESGIVRVERDGTVTVVTGSSAHGQGHETVFSQVVADQLGIAPERVAVRHGDTANTPEAVGSFGSRSAIMGGGALALSCQKVVDKGRRMAAHLLETAPEDVESAADGFAVVGAPDRRVSWADLAGAAYRSLNLPHGEEPGLEATTFFSPDGEMWGFGSHVALVRIEPDTGKVHVEKLVCVDDCGRVLNPLVVEGQVHGGIAQALGQALSEAMAWDADGQLITGSLMDYAMPRALDMPPIVLDHTVTPSPNNPLGVKGVGEAGTIGAPPAVLNACLDALAPLGVEEIDMPLTSQKLWSIIQSHASPA